MSLRREIAFDYVIYTHKFKEASNAEKKEKR